MRKLAVVSVLFALSCPIWLSWLAADEPKGEEAARRAGRHLEDGLGRYGGREFKFPEGTTTIKHITPTQSMGASYDEDGRVTRAAGGSYTLKGEAYEETPEYGLSEDFEVIRGKPQSFRCEVDGSRWHHDGKLSNGLTIDEVWERVEKK